MLLFRAVYGAGWVRFCEKSAANWIDLDLVSVVSGGALAPKDQNDSLFDRSP
jgi:hypothetical protein